MADKDILLAQRTILIDGPIGDESATDSIARLLYLNHSDSRSPIRMIIDSPGGTATGGMAIADTMGSIDAPVHTHCPHYAAGIALLLLTHGLKGNRTATMSSKVVFTTVWNPETSDEITEGLEALRRELAQLLAADTGRTTTDILSYMDQSWQLNAVQALALGIIDRVEAD
jgi:ATP-dependent Clp protease protease subunit